jgi:peptidyl-prolyl cis-trans isomerase-like protein 2
MDIMHAVPYVQKHKKHPVTGEPLELKQLTKLTFHKNDAGEYECPVLNKVGTVVRSRTLPDHHTGSHTTPFAW